MAVPAITKKALAESMKELMQDMAFSKISVTNICEKCGMSRKSFYYHFKDKYELVNWIFYTEFISFLEQNKDMDEHTFMTAICTYFYDNRAFYTNAFNVEGQNSFTEFFSDTLQSIAYESMQSRIGDHEFRDFFCTFLTNAVRESIIQWLKQGAPTPPKKFAALLEQALVFIDAESSADQKT